MDTRTASNRLKKERNEKNPMFMLWKFHNYVGKTKTLWESYFPSQEHLTSLSHVTVTMTQTFGHIRET